MIRSGEQFLKEIKASKRNVWIEGQKVQDLSNHFALTGISSTLAGLYDLAYQPQMRNTLAYQENGDWYNRSYMIPKSRDQLIDRAKMFHAWARHSCGMLGRSPDYLNSIVASWSAASEFFDNNHYKFGKNVRGFYEYCKRNDLALTHSVANMMQTKGGNKRLDDDLSLRVVQERDNGIVVSGCRIMATLAALCDEILIYPGRHINLAPSEDAFALAFAIPTSTDGLTFIARQSFAASDRFNHPLNSRFDEMDFLVHFDRVLIPWERVFIYRDVHQVNNLHIETNSIAHSAHQTVCKNIAKTEFILGVLIEFAQSRDLLESPQIQETIAQIFMHLEIMRSLKLSGEHLACADKWQVWTPDPVKMEVSRVVYMKVYNELIDLVRKVGSTQLMMIPSKEDLSSPIATVLNKIFGGSNERVRDSIQMNRIIWDLCCSSFAARQKLYEELYAGGVGLSLRFLFKLITPDAMEELTNSLSPAQTQGT